MKTEQHSVSPQNENIKDTEKGIKDSNLAVVEGNDDKNQQEANVGLSPPSSTSNTTSTSISISNSTNVTSRSTVGNGEGEKTSISNLESPRQEGCNDPLFEKSKIENNEDIGPSGVEHKAPHQQELPIISTGRDKKRQYQETSPSVNDGNTTGDYTSLSESKKLKEKKRRLAITTAIERLSKAILKVDPSNFIEHNNQVYSTIPTNATIPENKTENGYLNSMMFPHQMNKEEVLRQHQPLNRSSIILHATVLLEKLARESEETKIKIVEIEHCMFLMRKNQNGAMSMASPHDHSGSSNGTRRSSGTGEQSMNGMNMMMAGGGSGALSSPSSFPFHSHMENQQHSMVPSNMIHQAVGGPPPCYSSANSMLSSSQTDQSQQEQSILTGTFQQLQQMQQQHQQQQQQQQHHQQYHHQHQQFQ